LQFGEGGTDSKLFVDDLFSAYVKYASRHNIKSEIYDQSNGHVVAKLTGHNAGRAFLMEAGKHCVQRVPPTEHKGRRQTSLVSVAILPLPPERTLLALNENELEESFQTGSQKAGGRNANCVNSAVRLKHLPTGLCVFINGRDQVHNRKDARKILSVKVNNLYNTQNHTNYVKIKEKDFKNRGRGDKIRTYNYITSLVVDHRTGKKTNDIKSVLEKGKFELLYD
jgi:peptide chain release factor 1